MLPEARVTTHGAVAVRRFKLVRYRGLGAVQFTGNVFVRRGAASNLFGASKSMSDTVTTAKLLEDLQVLVRDAEALLQATAAQTGERVAEVRARTEESLHQARARLTEMQDDVVQQARDAAVAAEDYVKKNPWQSVGIAAGVGLLIGLLMNRRN
jgi:ElaB/YqjD/DUF883 family membrane-anchored ribosome-binding protein